MTKIAEGETKPIDLPLYDGEGRTQTAVDGTGLTLGVEIVDRMGGSVPTAGKIAWLVAASGTVRYSPAAEDFKAAKSPYAVRFVVTDGNGAVAKYPNGEADKWVVRR